MDNPFADPSVVEAQRAAANAPIEEDNPFAEAVAPAPASVNLPPSQVSGNMTPAPITPAASASAPSSNPKIENIPGHADLLKRQEELERKEAELERRERQMNQSSGANVQPNNWPPLPSWFPIKPCFYHDISLEIPLDFQKTVRYLYYLWMVYVVALFFNVLGNMTFWIIISKQSNPDTPAATGEEEAPGNFAKSILWLILFSPCSMCWYIPAYRAFKSDSSFNFFIFFFIFFFQICWLLLMVIGVPGMGFCGWTIAITGLKTNVAGGIVAMIAALLFTVTFIFGIVMLRKVHQIYGATGATFAKAMSEGQGTFNTAVWSNQHVRNAAQEAATQAASHAAQNAFK